MIHCAAQSLCGSYASIGLAPFIRQHSVRSGTWRNDSFVTVERIKAMCTEMNIPSLREVGITPDDYKMLAEAAMKESCMQLNARECTAEDVLSIYQKLN